MLSSLSSFYLILGRLLEDLLETQHANYVPLVRLGQCGENFQQRKAGKAGPFARGLGGVAQGP